MSFRGRLTLFFLLIVVLPMIAVAVLVTQIVTESTNGKADARLAEGLDSALTVYRDDAAAARDAAKQVASDPAVTTAIDAGAGSQVSSVANRLLGEHGIRARGDERRAGGKRGQQRPRRSLPPEPGRPRRPDRLDHRIHDDPVRVSGERPPPDGPGRRAADARGRGGIDAERPPLRPPGKRPLRRRPGE
jgi:hypothetical protein